MTDERKSGIALIAGSVAGIITMALHPGGHHVLTAQQFESLVPMLIAVHALGLASVPIMFLGAWGLSRYAGTPDRIAMAALVIYASGLLAIMNAAVYDGLVAPAILRQMAFAAPSASDMWHTLFNYNFRQNQAFAQLYVAASSLAIVLWSVSFIRSHALTRSVAVYGCILGPITFAALVSGYLRLDAHGFGMVMLCQAIWFITVGVLLCRIRNA